MDRASPTASQISASGISVPLSATSQPAPPFPPSGPSHANSSTSSSHAADTAIPTPIARSRDAASSSDCARSRMSLIPDRQDLVGFLAARRRHLDAVALVLADERARERRAHVQKPALEVRLLLDYIRRGAEPFEEPRLIEEDEPLEFAY